MKRYIALVDCDSFYVSCEQAINKELENKAVCVIGSTDGCVLSRSKEAKKAGIKMGAPYFIAKKDFPDIIFICANMPLYSQISEKVMLCLKQFSPDVEQYSIDEAFLDISGCEKLYKKKYVEIVQMIKAEVKNKTSIPVSIGLSSSKTLAKLASDKAKKTNGIFYINEKAITQILKKTNIEEVWGIGTKNTIKLKQEGILSAFDFISLPDSWIKGKLGVVGLKLKRELLGECVSKVDSKEKLPESIQKTASFKKCTSDILIIKKALKSHIHNACIKLRGLNGFCDTVGIMLRTKDFHVFFDKKSINNSTNFELEISKIADELVNKIYDENILYRSCGIVLEKLTFSTTRQTSLFDDNKIQKNISLAKTLDKIEEKFGKNSIQIGF